MFSPLTVVVSLLALSASTSALVAPRATPPKGWDTAALEVCIFLNLYRHHVKQYSTILALRYLPHSLSSSSVPKQAQDNVLRRMLSPYACMYTQFTLFSLLLIDILFSL